MCNLLALAQFIDIFDVKSITDFELFCPKFAFLKIFSCVLFI